MDINRCSVCGRTPKLYTKRLVSLKLYYVECKCGNKGFARVHKEDAAEEWNIENRKGD